MILDRRRYVFAWLGLIAGTLLTGPPNSASAGRLGFDPTSQYESRDVEGWTVLVNKRLLRDQGALSDQVLELLRFQLYQVERMVPKPAVEKLRSVRFWIEENSPEHPCAAYHPDPRWLQEHGMNPDKARSIEIANARNFLSWTKDQPWMTMHELAHAYHHQFLANGYENSEIRLAFERAMKSKLYDSVLHFDGETVRAYAAKNPMEFFAEATEAFFGTNDFYPFVRSELRRHDAETLDLLRKLWDEPAGSRRA